LAWCAFAVVVATAHVAPALAGDWKSELALGARATLTNNVNLGPPGQEEADLYFTVTPSIRTSRQGARLQASLSYRPSLTVYASQADASKVANSLTATGKLEAVSDFFFVDASASISQTFLTPFGTQPPDIGSITENRAETYAASLSPYIKGRFGAAGTYELRNTTAWSATDSSLTEGSVYVRWSGRASAPLSQRASWSVQGSRSTNYFGENDGLYTDVVRALLTYRLAQDLSMTLRVGYEDNNYALNQNTTGAIYGLGATWTPTPRTNVTGFFEKRFFGTGYNFSATHRHRRTAISLYGSRDVRTYAELLFELPPGDTRTLLDALLTARVPDPTQREQAIDQFLLISGAPATLGVPTTYYSQRINLVENLGASLALLGVRNSVILSTYWLRNEPVSTLTGQPLPPEFATLERYITYGASANWSYRLTGRSRASFLVSRSYTRRIDVPEDDSTNTLARLELNTLLGPRTTGSIGVRWTQFDAALRNSYTEYAIFAAGNHVF
jgi:uncharacterized protein (PEP-CTERM system associated)